MLNPDPNPQDPNFLDPIDLGPIKKQGLDLGLVGRNLDPTHAYS